MADTNESKAVLKLQIAEYAMRDAADALEASEAYYGRG